MEYKGYRAAVRLDDGLFHGRVLGLRDVVTFQGTSVEELQADFEGAVDFYLETCAKLGKEPDRPFSGTLNLRMPADLHRDAYLSAEMTDESINTLIVTALEHELERRGLRTRRT